MVRFMAMLFAVLAALPARADDGDLTAAYIQWERLRNPDTAGVGFNEGVSFLEQHPDWPEEKFIRLRIEGAALLERPPHEVMVRYCADNSPISGRGMIACAQAQAGSAKTNEAWVRQGWIQGDFSNAEEDRILATYAKLLTHADQVARTDRLLYETKVNAAREMLPLVRERANLYAARIAFITDNRRAPVFLKKLDKNELRDLGLVYDRLRWRQRHDMDDQLAELLLTVPKNAPYPDLWWPMRAVAARTAMGKHDYKQASTLLATMGALKNEYLAEALWLKGWLSLQHHDDAGSGYQDFYQLYTSVYTPVSKARAAYWAGRAAEKNGNPDIAREWMGKADRYPTVFYGQLAHVWLKKKAPLPLPATPIATVEEKRAFEHNDLVRVAQGLAQNGDVKMRDLFLSALANHATTDGEFLLATNLARELGGVASGVEIAKLALRDGFVMMDAGWPRIAVPKDTTIEPALTLAIVRQESEFNPQARSGANAYGLMQLLPGTAQQIARRIGFDYTGRMITDANVNMLLGSNYLGQLIRGFDGSYILGIASYNAGPGSVRKWIVNAGPPPKSVNGAIDWIEAIPFAETRNYVMRVLENVTVYRALAEPGAPVELEQDLKR